ncbi:hypothetical protein [Streptomyces sp. 6N223]|uniref:hypothetical protein n=1 Tax=Streptomyces sp. 6N223 TaxID=3457412 RepID=UPI003FD1D58D
MTEIRLRWWAVLLPAAVFAALLTLLVAGTNANAGAVGQRQPVTQPVTGLVDQVRQAFFP